MKVITPDNYLIRPFRTNKSWTFDYSYLSGSNPSEVRIDLASEPPVDWRSFTTGTEGQNADGIYTRPLYASVQHMFYTGSRHVVTGSRYKPLGARDKKFYPTGSQFYVINVEQKTFGEGIRPGSFEVSAGNSTASIVDDGLGRLVSTTDTSTVIGNIFYGLGVAVVKQDTGSYSSSLVTDRGLYLGTGSVVTVQYAGIHTIYEHNIICTVEPGELNFSTNPTIRNPSKSGSFSASVYIPTTGSTASDLVFSGSLQPYFTTLGLYNDRGEMLAVAKFPRAIRRVTNTQQSVIVRLDA
jgi:hypothetical protein